MTSPIFNADVPLRKDIFADSQIDFLDNFSTLYNAFSQNHIPLDALNNAGNHTIIQLLEQSAQFQTNVGEISVYTKNVPGQTDQIFLRYQGNQQEFQFTNYQIYSIPSIPNVQSFFFTFLPGKILVYFGVVIPNSVNFGLKLMPQVARNIITVNFCPIGTGTDPLYPPIANLGSTIPGIITDVFMSSSFLLGVVPPPCYYLVMANI